MNNAKARRGSQMPTTEHERCRILNKKYLNWYRKLSPMTFHEVSYSIKPAAPAAGGDADFRQFSAKRVHEADH